jgi:hypothetical protein
LVCGHSSWWTSGLTARAQACTPMEVYAPLVSIVSKICVPAALPTLPGRHFVKLALDVTRGAVLMASITVSRTHAVAHARFIHGLSHPHQQEVGGPQTSDNTSDRAEQHAILQYELCFHCGGGGLCSPSVSPAPLGSTAAFRAMSKCARQDAPSTPGPTVPMAQMLAKPTAHPTAVFRRRAMARHTLLLKQSHTTSSTLPAISARSTNRHPQRQLHSPCAPH